jgi:hypothetical protein
MTAVTETETQITSATGLSQNEVRQIALWFALGDSDGAATFLREVVPAWHQARAQATMRAADR